MTQFLSDPGDAPVTPPPARHAPRVEQTVDPAGRPGTVTIAAMLMVTTAALFGLGGVLLTYDALTRSASDFPSTTVYNDFVVAWTAIGITLFVIGVLVIVFMAAVLRGHNWARAVTFAIGSLFMVASAGLALITVAGAETDASMDGDLLDPAQLSSDILVGMGLVWQSGNMCATIVLLALPVSNRWFQRTRADRIAAAN